MSAFSKRRSRLAVPMFVLALAAAAPSHAAGFAGVDSFWSWFLQWLPVTSPFDIGPIIDPNGRNGSQSDIGPMIDPLGRNGTASATGRSDIGPIIDPDGRKGTSSPTGQGDIGPEIDPLGGKG